MIFWRDLLNFETRDWMDWRLLAHQKFLSSNKLAIKPIMGLNPPEKEYKLKLYRYAGPFMAGLGLEI